MRMSEQINELAAALADAKPKFGAVKKTHTAKVKSAKGDYSYTYSTLDDLDDATSKVLSEHGVFVWQNAHSRPDGGVGVSTLLMHKSGQFIETDPFVLPGGGTPQSAGSASTYARRYSLSAALGIAAEEDDDGQRAKAAPRERSAPRQEAAAQQRQPAPQEASRAAAPRGDDRVISEPQRKRLYAISKEQGWSDEDLKRLIKKRGYESGKDIRMADYDAIIKVLQTGEVGDEREPGGDDLDFPAPWEEGSAH